MIVYESRWDHVLQVSFPHSQAIAHITLSQTVSFTQLGWLLLYFMQWNPHSIMWRILGFQKCLYVTDNLSRIFMPSEVISSSYYWHFSQTGTVHSKWIPVFHDGFIAPVNLYSAMYCTCFLFMHNTLHIFLDYTAFT